MDRATALLPLLTAKPEARCGFWKGFFATWVVVLAAHALAFLGMGFAPALPYPEQTEAIFSLATLTLVPARLVVPPIAGTAYSLIRNTSFQRNM